MAQSLIKDKFVELKRLEKQSAKLANDLQELEVSRYVSIPGSLCTFMADYGFDCH